MYKLVLIRRKITKDLPDGLSCEKALPLWQAKKVARWCEGHAALASVFITPPNGELVHRLMMD